MVNAVMETIVTKHIQYFMSIGAKEAALEKAVVIKRKTRPINPLRHGPDGSYNSHCLDNNYAHNYSEEKLKGVVVKCLCCESEVLRTKLGKHRRSKKCKHVAMCQAHNALPS